MISNAVPAKKIANVMSAKTSKRSKPLRLAMFASFSEPSLRELGTEQVRLILQASLAVAMMP